MNLLLKIQKFDAKRKKKYRRENFNFPAESLPLNDDKNEISNRLYSALVDHSKKNINNSTSLVQ